MRKGIAVPIPGSMEPPAKRHKGATDCKACLDCGQRKERQDFFKKQFKKPSGEGCCRACMVVRQKEQQANALKKTCRDCGQTKQFRDFSKKERKKPSGEGLCSDCLKKLEIRLANQPRLCLKCNVQKEKTAFSEHQWRDRDRKCLACFPEEEEAALRKQIAEKKEQDRLNAEEARIIANKARIKAKKEAHFREMIQLKMQHDIELYDYRAFEKLKDANLNMSLTDTDVPKLVGTYDVIFTSFYASHNWWSRTTRGTLELSSKDGFLHGTVKMDPSLPQRGGLMECDFQFRQQDKSDKELEGSGEVKDEIPLSIEDGEDLDIALELENVTASFRVLAKETALPWTPHSDLSDGDVVDGVYAEGLRPLVEKRANYHDCQDSWLKREIPESAVKLVHSFTGSYRPKPEFLLKQGDVIVSVCWVDDFTESCDSVIVGRRRPD